MTEFERDDQKKIMSLLMEFFKQDIEKVIWWMTTQNPLLGNVAPVVFLRLGRTDKLLKFIEGLISKNER